MCIACLTVTQKQRIYVLCNDNDLCAIEIDVYQRRATESFGDANVNTFTV